MPIIVDGEIVYDKPGLAEIKDSVKRNLAMLSDEHTRLLNPHRYHVDLSLRLWEAKMKLLGGIEFETH